MHNYWGFGLNIKSEIAFPELLVHNSDSSDVQICMGTVPASIEGVFIDEPEVNYTINNNELLFRVKNIAKYYATNGNSIIVEIEDIKNEMRTIRLYILATVMASVLLQRKLLPLHASAIIMDNQLILITGDSGAGKSTALAGLIKKGHAVFSDDVIVLHNKLATVVATASYPMIKLWDDTMVKLEHELFDDRSFIIKPGMDKYGIFFHKQFNQNSYAVKKIIILKKNGINQIVSRKITGAEIFKELAKQIYRPMLLQDNNLLLLTFNLFSSLMNTVSVYEITRPEECSPTDLLVCVESLL